MNILIPHSWLKEYLETKAKPNEIANWLSLCGPSVERIKMSANDFVYDIEVTTNRVDSLCITGIAREAAAILPQFGIKAKLKKEVYEVHQVRKVCKDKKLKVIIKDQSLCPRFSAVVLENVTIKPSPKIIQERLLAVAMRPLNNIIDTSNYLMHEFGQPVHVFDYDKIGQKTMILRLSKKGEKIVTLDKKSHALPGGDIVIEDGDKRLIDLCGIMGGLNSCVDKYTKKVLLFVQNYNPSYIRKTSMTLAHRTQAAVLFEKQVDPELVMPTLLKGIQLIKQNAGGRIISDIIDLYPNPYKPKTVNLSLQFIEARLGVKMRAERIKSILEPLGFKVKSLNAGLSFKITVPSWRSTDINIKEDIIEEIARIHGYYNLPSVLPPLFNQPRKPLASFCWEARTKQLLADLGFTEIYTYSMQSRDELKKFNLSPREHLKIKNPLSQDWVYMRTNLIPSMLTALNQNKGKSNLKFFELANVYLAQKNNLPEEKLMLLIALKGEKYYLLKGVCETLLVQLGIKQFDFLPLKEKKAIWHPLRTANFFVKNKLVGQIGELASNISRNFEIDEKITLLYLEFDALVTSATDRKTYTPISKYPPVIEDLSLTVPDKTLTADLMKAIKKSDKLVNNVELLSRYKNTQSFRITYLDKQKQIEANQLPKIRQNIIEGTAKLGAELKGVLV